MPPNDSYMLSQHEKKIAHTKNNPDQPESCWPCRITSGVGLIGSAGYVIYYMDRAKGRFARGFLLCTASGLVSLGAARLFGLPPFGSGGPDFPPDEPPHE